MTKPPLAFVAYLGLLLFLCFFGLAFPFERLCGGLCPALNLAGPVRLALPGLAKQYLLLQGQSQSLADAYAFFTVVANAGLVYVLIVSISASSDKWGLAPEVKKQPPVRLLFAFMLILGFLVFAIFQVYVQGTGYNRFTRDHTWTSEADFINLFSGYGAVAGLGCALVLIIKLMFAKFRGAPDTLA